MSSGKCLSLACCRSQLGMCRIDFLNFCLVLVRFLKKKLPIRSGMSVVWFGMKKCGSVQILELFTTDIIAE